jgi:hypothetical protein
MKIIQELTDNLLNHLSTEDKSKLQLLGFDIYDYDYYYDDDDEDYESFFSSIIIDSWYSQKGEDWTESYDLANKKNNRALKKTHSSKKEHIEITLDDIDKRIKDKKQEWYIKYGLIKKYFANDSKDWIDQSLNNINDYKNLFLKLIKNEKFNNFWDMINVYPFLDIFSPFEKGEALKAYRLLLKNDDLFIQNSWILNKEDINDIYKLNKIIKSIFNIFYDLIQDDIDKIINWSKYTQNVLFINSLIFIKSLKNNLQLDSLTKKEILFAISLNKNVLQMLEIDEELNDNDFYLLSNKRLVLDKDKRENLINALFPKKDDYELNFISAYNLKALSKYSDFKEEYILKELISDKSLKNNLCLNLFIENNHIDATKFFIENNFNLDSKGIFDSTPLIYASIYGYKEIVELLVKKGVDISIQDKSGFTALTYALEHGYKNIVEILIQAGADINAKDNCGFTALIYASIHGYKNIVQLLIQVGADVNIQDNNGFTALIYALEQKYESIVQLIIQAGAK